MTTPEVPIIAALTLLALAAFVLLSKKARDEAPLAALALLLAGIEAADWLALDASHLTHRAVVVLDSLLPVSALWYGVSFGRLEPARAFKNRGAWLLAAAVLFPATALFAPLTSFFYSPDFQTERLFFLGTIGYWFYLALTLACVAALMHIEATFTSTSGGDRWKIKFEIIGMSAIFACLIFYFSQALLYRTINANLLPIRSCILIIAAGVVLFSKLFRGNGVRVAVSRYILYRSITLVAVGIYFIILGILGEGMKYLPLPFQTYLTILTAFAGGIALLIALLSERLRRSFKVFLSKHFLAQKHDYRQTWLHLTRKLASHATAGDMEKAIPGAYCEIFGLREASLYLLDVRTGRYVQCGGKASLGGSFLPSLRLLSYFQERNRVWNPADGEYARATEEELSFVRASHARLVVPLIGNHTVEGLVTLGESVADEPFTYEDYDLMKIVARQSALLLSNHRLSQELMEARELAAMARVSSFVVHDLKNLTHTLSLITDNAEEHIGNAEFQRDMMAAIRHTLAQMKKLTQKLKGFRRSDKSAGEPVDIRLLCETIVKDFSRTRPGTAILCRGDSAFCSVNPEELSKVVVNLVQNGLDAAGEKGTVTVETGIKDGRACLQVSDNGCGMARDFMQRQLFKPFRSTKQTGLGIGLYQCGQIVESFGGTIEVISETGKGSCFTVCLPVSDRSLTLVT